MGFSPWYLIFMQIHEHYQKIKPIIDIRLEEFRNILWREDVLFKELAFCLCTPQSKARVCDRAISKMGNNIFSYSRDEILKNLSGVRFPSNKAGYIIEARKNLKNLLKLKNMNSYDAREWLVKNVKGLGYKEASHFLRNIGLGKDLTILDRHILKNLKLNNVIDDIPVSLTPKKYKEIEQKMLQFSERNGIPLDALDLVFWSMETGEVFK